MKRSPIGVQGIQSQIQIQVRVVGNSKMARSLCVAVLAAVALARAEGGAIRAEVQALLGAAGQGAEQGEVAELATAQPAICYEILEQPWWKERKQLNPSVANGPSDVACSRWNQANFGNDRDLCNQKETRQEELKDQRLSFTAAQWNAACTVRGAHDHSCISNPVSRSSGRHRRGAAARLAHY